MVEEIPHYPELRYRVTSNKSFGETASDAVVSHFMQSVDLLMDPKVWDRLWVCPCRPLNRWATQIIPLEQQIPLNQHPDYLTSRKNVERAIIILDYTKEEFKYHDSAVVSKPEIIMTFEWVLFSKDCLPEDYDKPEHPLKYIGDFSGFSGCSLKDILKHAKKKYPSLSESDFALGKKCEIEKFGIFNAMKGFELSHVCSYSGYCYAVDIHLLNQHQQYMELKRLHDWDSLISQ